jgi:hypothetical protein
METIGIWKYGHMDMETWTWSHRHGVMDMETWTQKYGREDMDIGKIGTWLWRNGHEHEKTCVVITKKFFCKKK